MKFSNLLEKDLEVFEQAFSKSDLKRFYFDKMDIIYLHLIKIFRFEDPYNFKKHCNDIDTWILDLQKKKSKSRLLNSEEIYNYLFGFQSEFDVYLETLKQLEKYKSLKLTNFSDEEIHSKLKTVYKKVAKDLSVKKFKTISDYLD